MTRRRLKIGFAGARWLGINCLKYLVGNKAVEITNVCFPPKSEKVWWTDVVDNKEIKNLGFSNTPWDRWKELKFDLVFSVLHGGIFKKIHLDNSRFGIINLHPAPLPEYRGCNSYAHAIINGDRNYRVSFHYVDEGIDDGPIIGQNVIPIEKLDTGFSLYSKAQISALELFKNKVGPVINTALEGKMYPAKKQDESKARYYMRTSLNDKEAKLSWSKEKLYNFVRALDFPPFEPAHVILEGEKIFLTLSQR